MSITDDPSDPRIKRGGPDETPAPMSDAYLVLPASERAKGFVRPFRNKYTHRTCGTSTRMGDELSETYARDPKFYGFTYCVGCGMHRPVAEFTWDADGQAVGS